MSKEKIQIGFIGCGGIAFGKHFPGMSKEEDVELVAFCDIIEERAQRAAKEYGTPDAKVYTDYKELLKDESIDAVHVLTPNVSHADLTCDALRAGKHVLCEKPMAATREDAKRMLDARNETGKLLTIGYQYRHFPVNATAKKVVSDGWVGDVYYAEASYLRRRGVPTWGVFLDKEQQGGGPLIDIGTHALDLTLWMMDNYEPLYAVGTSFEKLGTLLEPDKQGQTGGQGEPNPWNNETFEVEDLAIGHIKMKNGAVINLRASWAVNMSDETGANSGAHVTLAGTKGGIDTIQDVVRLNHVVAGQQSSTTVGRKISPYIPGFSGGEPPKSKETHYWVQALKGEGELFVTADQAYVVSAILDAIYESSRTNKPVYLDEI